VTEVVEEDVALRVGVGRDRRTAEPGHQREDSLGVLGTGFADGDH
jgi:hypothetical protein